MKLTKKHYLILAIVVLAIAVWYFFLRKKKAESGFTKDQLCKERGAGATVANPCYTMKGKMITAPW